MSFGYLIITSEPCSVLTQTRGQAFSLIEEKPISIFISVFAKAVFTRSAWMKKQL